MSKSERYSATMLGCAIGDALGVPIEGWRREWIEKYFGSITGFIGPDEYRQKIRELQANENESGIYRIREIDFGKGEYSDDTILTIALAESLIESGFDIGDAAKRQMLWYDKDRKRGFGGTTQKAFKNLRMGISPENSGIIGAPGNGPAMKSAPIGIYMDATGRYDEGIKFAEYAARITHLDPRSVASGVLQAHAVYMLLSDISRDDFIGSLHEACRKHEKPLTPGFLLRELGDLSSRIKWLEDNKDANADAAYECLGNSGLVTESYPFALFMFQKYWNDPVKGLMKTINYGGDCDTTGAIYGALAGAKNGVAFPKNWIEDLEGSEYLMELGRRFASLGD